MSPRTVPSMLDQAVQPFNPSHNFLCSRRALGLLGSLLTKCMRCDYHKETTTNLVGLINSPSVRAISIDREINLWLNMVSLTGHGGLPLQV